MTRLFLRFVGVDTPTSLVAPITVIALALCACASAALAQEPAPAQVSALTGSRVRVTSSQVDSRVSGFVEEVDKEVLTLRSDGGGLIKLPLASIARVDVSLGRKRNVLQGFAAGAVAGFLIAFAMPVDPGQCHSGEPIFCSRGEAMVGSIIPISGIGALIGTFIKRERWTRMTIPRSVPAGATGVIP
jgi:hypothetical protein